MRKLYRLSFYRLSLRTATMAALVSGLFLAGFPPIAKAEDPLFTVHGVRVDVTAESAVAARTEAFEKAQQDAFKMLAERLLPESDAQEFQVPASTTISPMVKDFEITGEQLSRVQYIGTYTFRFKESAIRNFFADKNVSFSDVRSKPVLILPFYQWGSKNVLWGENNPWLAAWGQTDTRQGLVPVQVPIGDISDVKDIGDAQALTYSTDNLHSMIQRYGAGEAIIVIAAPKWEGGDGNGEPVSLEMMIYRTDLGAPAFVKTVSVTTQEKNGTETIFDAGVRAVRQTFQSDWKSKTVAQAAESNILKARVRFASLREWADTQKALREVNGISYMRVVRLAPKQAEIEITYSGTEDRLRLALSQANMSMSEPQASYMDASDYGAAPAMMYDLYMNPPEVPAATP